METQNEKAPAVVGWWISVSSPVGASGYRTSLAGVVSGSRDAAESYARAESRAAERERSRFSSEAPRFYVSGTINAAEWPAAVARGLVLATLEG